MFKKPLKAFTLVELLVVIAIIGLLATLSVIALNTARAKARDAKRIADIKQTQTALEMFYNDAGRYPTPDEWNSGSLSYSSAVYMATIPIAAIPPDGTCDNDTNSFSYTQISDGASYTLSFCLGGNTGSLSSGPTYATPDGLSNTGGGMPVFACGDAVSYGGESYPTVQIGSQCWMTKNMDIGTRITPSTSSPCTQTSASSNPGWSCQQNDGQIEKYCYNNDDSQCSVYGGLYEWAEALQLPVSCTISAVNCSSTPSSACCNFATPIKGICPTGWHVPTNAEFQTLSDNLGGNSTAGQHLKESGTSHWSSGNTGDNSSGFTMLGAGNWNSRNGIYQLLGQYANFWAASTQGDQSDRIQTYFNSNDYMSFSGIRDRGWSVRCLKD